MYMQIIVTGSTIYAGLIATAAASLSDATAFAEMNKRFGMFAPFKPDHGYFINLYCMARGRG